MDAILQRHRARAGLGAGIGVNAMKRFLRRRDVRPDASRDVDDELQFHLEMRTREFIEAGLSPGDAREAAGRAFGDVDAIDAELRLAGGAQARTRERNDHIRDLLMDVKFAARTLRKNASFTAAALATLALGIGATTAVFTVVDGVLLRPLPYTDPSRVEMVWLSSKRASLGNELPFSAGFYEEIVAHDTSFSSTAAFRSWSYALSSGGDVQQLTGARVTPSLFAVLGTRPALGRPFIAADAEPGAAHVVVISDALWHNEFGANPSAVGARITLGGESFQVVGVMPPGFAFPRGAELPAGLQFAARTDVWTPLSFTPKERLDFGTLNLAAVGRLRPTTDAGRASAELAAHLGAFLKTNAPTLQLGLRMLDLAEQAGQHVRRGLLLLFGAAAFVLVIACANVVNLLVARTSTRGREFAVRAALGAGRARIVRQLVTENVLLAMAGSALGMVLSVVMTRSLLAAVPGSMPRMDDVRVDWRVVLAVTGMAIGVGAALGLLTTLQVRWNTLAGTLHDGGARATRGRARSVGRRLVVVTEVSLSLMLVIGAVLLTLSFRRLQRVEPGFTPSGVLTASVVLPIPAAFDPQRDGRGWARFFAQLVDRLARAPGVAAAGAVSALPLTGTIEGGGMAIAGQPTPAAGQALQAEYAVIQGDYFQAMGIRLIAGRRFGSGDLAGGAPVVIVNRQFARQYLSGMPAIDKQIIPYFDFSNGQARTIVGVVDDVQSATLDAPIKPQVYIPEQQMSYPGLRIVIRTSGDPMSALPLLKREIKSLDPRIAVADVRSIEHIFDESLARRKFSTTIVAVFAASALALAIVGLYGLIALSVGQRRREIGVRMALGARPSDILRQVLGEGVVIAAIGLAAGLAGAFALSETVAAMLYDVSATSTAVYAGAAVAIGLVTLTATFVPARRATQVDPTSALRAD